MAVATGCRSHRVVALRTSKLLSLRIDGSGYQGPGKKAVLSFRSSSQYESAFSESKFQVPSILSFPYHLVCVCVCVCVCGCV